MRVNKARLDDVVRLSGLSKSTVDRVLNGRDGVRPETTARVEAALKALGYAASALSSQLAAGGGGRVDVLLPAGESQFFDEVRRNLERVVAEQGHSVRFIPMNMFDPASLVLSLRSVKPATEAIILVAMDTPEVREAINHLERNGTRVVTIIADCPSSRRTAYVGQDNFSSGRTAGSLVGMLAKTPEADVAILIGHLGLRNHLDRRSGFEQVLAEYHPQFRVHMAGACRDDADEADRLISRLLSDKPHLSGLYVAGGPHQGAIRALMRARPQGLVVISHDLTQMTRDAVMDGTYRAIIAQDLGEMARQAFASALVPAAIESRLPVNIYFRENLPPS